MLQANNAGYAVKQKWLVKNFSYRFEPGKCYMLCGPNGAGKSTLLKMLSLELEPAEGSILYNGAPVHIKQKKIYAKQRAVLSQQVDISFPMPVEEVVMMGRYPHFASNPASNDIKICDHVMQLLDVKQFRHRNFMTLSGGEKQRVQFARVLAQIWEPPSGGNRILLLDEPISSLDLKHQFDFLQQLKNFIDPHTVVVAILHDLNLALNYASEVLLLHEGRLFASGQPKAVLSKENIQQVFGMNTRLHAVPGANLIWAENR